MWMRVRSRAFLLGVLLLLVCASLLVLDDGDPLRQAAAPSHQERRRSLAVAAVASSSSTISTDKGGGRRCKRTAWSSVECDEGSTQQVLNKYGIPPLPLPQPSPSSLLSKSSSRRSSSPSSKSWFRVLVLYHGHYDRRGSRFDPKKTGRPVVSSSPATVFN